MAIIKTGAFFEDFIFGDFNYGDSAAGTVTVNGGDTFTFSASNTSSEPFVAIGQNLGGNGAATITGTGSEIVVQGNGNANEAAGFQVGLFAGSTGALNISAGGLLKVSDLVGVAGTGSTGGQEEIIIGHLGGTGTATVNAGAVIVEGTGARFGVGIADGAGTATFSNSSTLTVTSLTGDSSDNAEIQIGSYDDTGGSDGTLTFDNSTATVTATGASTTTLSVGRGGGTGILNLNGTSTLTFNGGSSYASHGGGIGEDGGDGTININDTAQLNYNGDVGEVYFNVGRNGGTAEINVAAGGQINFTADSFSGIQIGRAGVGTTATFNNSGDFNLTSNLNDAYFNIGRDGSNGTVNNFGSIDLVGGLNAGMHVGRGGTGGGTGTLNQDGGTITIDSGANAYFGAGAREFSNGTVLMENSSLLQMDGVNESTLFVGRNNGSGAGVGTMEVESGSTVDVNSQGNVFMGIGDSSTGTMRFDDADLDVDATNQLGFNVGVDYGNGAGLGLVEVLNGSTVTLDTVSTSFIGGNVGFGTGSTGTLTITDSSFTMSNADGETFQNFGRGGGTGNLNLNNSTYTQNATSWAGIQAGRDSGAVGNISITNSSLLEINSSYATYFTFGRDGGTSVVDIDDSTVRFSGTGTVLTDPISGDPIESGGNIGRFGGNGTVNLTNGSLFEITDTGISVFLNVGVGASSLGELNLTDSTMNVNTTGSSGLAVVNVGRDGSTGDINLDNSDMAVTSANDFAGVRIGAEFSGTVPTPSNGNAILTNGTTINISGDTAALSVAYTTNATGNLEVLSGSTINVSDTGGTISGTTFGSVFLVGHEDGSLAGTVLIDGTGSAIQGMDATVIGHDRTFSGIPTGTGNGTVTVSDGGTLSSGDFLFVGYGGTLSLDDGQISATNGTEVRGGTLNILEGGADVSGNLDVEGGTINIEADLATGNTGSVAYFNSDVSINGTSQINLDVQNGFLTAGASFVLYTLSGSSTFDSDATFSVLNQNAGFSYAFDQGMASGTFYALNNGDGTGSGDLDFGSASSNAVIFDYDSDIGSGEGSGGVFTDVSAYNLDRIFGTSVADAIFDFGNSGITIDGRGGNDDLGGGGGADTISGGTGADTINGGAGQDTLNGDEGVDTINGDQGDDTIFGGSGNDILEGGAGQGTDTIHGGDDNDTINGRNGVDFLYGDGGNDIINGQNKNDVLEGGAGDDTLSGNKGNDTILGGADNDTIYGGASADTVSGDGGNDDVYGGGQADLVYGGSGDDTVDGGSGNDYVSGGSGNDDVFGGNGTDQLFGNKDNDLLVGGEGNDVMTGGSGSDVFQFNVGDIGDDTILDFTENFDMLEFTGAITAGDISITSVGGGMSTLITVVGYDITIRLDGVDSSTITTGDDMMFT